MDAIAQLQAKISQFPGYDDETQRARSDELVRSYLGEALAALEERLAGQDTALRERFGDLLLRVGFANQLVYRQYEERARTAPVGDSVAPSDADVVALADRAPAVEGDGVQRYLDEVRTALDRRDAAMSGRLTVS